MMRMKGRFTKHRASRRFVFIQPCSFPFDLVSSRAGPAFEGHDSSRAGLAGIVVFSRLMPECTLTARSVYLRT